jgi:Flp pilus assembly protein TadD
VELASSVCDAVEHSPLIPSRAAYELLRAALQSTDRALVARSTALFACRLAHDSRSHAWLSFALARLQRGADAVTMGKRAVALGPNHAMCWRSLAHAYRAVGDSAAAQLAQREAERLMAHEVSRTSGHATGVTGT